MASRGLVAKRIDSSYEPGLRSGARQKMRVSRGQEFVIGGDTVGARSFDAVIFGYCEGDRLLYAARNGFTPAARAVVKGFKRQETSVCPFANLPTSGRWGAGLTAKKMADHRCVRPELVPVVEWTDEGHLRHSRFVGLRDDIEASGVRREVAPGVGGKARK
jgi:bifunctional non-homologous end joining protein LigD